MTLCTGGLHKWMDIAGSHAMFMCQLPQAIADWQLELCGLLHLLRNRSLCNIWASDYGTWSPWIPLHLSELQFVFRSVAVLIIWPACWPEERLIVLWRMIRELSRANGFTNQSSPSC